MEKQQLNRSVLFIRAWQKHRLLIKHGCKSALADHLRRAYKIAKLVGYKNYQLQQCEKRQEI